MTIDNRKHYGHRLAFLYMTGSIPARVDHIDGNPSNCRWANLRAATQSENMANTGIGSRNKSGFKGVHWENGRWCASIRKHPNKYFLGYFDDPAEAHRAYVNAAEALFGEFANAG